MKKIFYIFSIFIVLSICICIPSKVSAYKETVNMKKYTSKYSREVKKSNYEESILHNYSYYIPDARSNFVPQGLCKATYGGKTFRLITAYDSNNRQNSRIYIINSNGTHLTSYQIAGTKGSHVGGITEYKEKIWIVSTDRLYIINKANLLRAAACNKIDDYGINYPTTIYPTASIMNTTLKTQIQSQRRLSFCTTDGTYLWIGTYDKSLESYAFGYEYEGNGLVQVAEMKIPKKCQGMTFGKNNQVFLSASDGRIYKYSYIKFARTYTSAQGKIGNRTVNILKVDTWTYRMEKLKTITVPTYAQEIYLTDNGNLYVLFESCAKEYYKQASSVEYKVVLLSKNYL